MPFHFFLNPVEEISQRGRKKWLMSFSGPEPSHLPTGLHGPVGPTESSISFCQSPNLWALECLMFCSQITTECKYLDIWAAFHLLFTAFTWWFEQAQEYSRPWDVFSALLHYMLVWFKGWKLWVVEMPSLSLHLSKPNEKKTNPQYIATGIKISTQKKKKTGIKIIPKWSHYSYAILPSFSSFSPFFCLLIFFHLTFSIPCKLKYGCITNYLDTKKEFFS